MSFCGDNCTIGGGLSGAIEGHRFTIELASNEIDTRVFGDGEYGSYLACSKNGTVSVDSYVRPDFDIGDSLTISVCAGNETYSIPSIVTNQTVNVDAKDVVQFTTKFRIVDNVTIS